MRVGGKSDIVDIEYDRIKIDDAQHKSILIQFGDKDVWLPCSLIEVDVDGETVAMPEWKAMQEGLI